MKFLDVARLNAVTSFLENCTVGDRRLRGRVEAYSCKMAGEDKKLHKHLQQQFQEEGNSWSLGEQNEAQNRKLLINLICTMNATFPDYDFSGLKPDQFVRKNLGMVINAVNTNLSEIVDKHNTNFLEELWGAIDQEIDLKQCEVLSYIPDVEDDPFNEPGSLWSFNFFFHNAAKRMMVFFTCCCTPSWRGEDFYGTARQEEEEDAEFVNDAASDSEDEVDDLLDVERFNEDQAMIMDSDESDEDDL